MTNAKLLWTTAMVAGIALAVPAVAQDDSVTETAVVATTSDTDADAATHDATLRPIVAMGGGLDPLGGGVQQKSGVIDPLKGMIRTFGGDIDPFIGRIRTFEGGIDPTVGRIRTFEGDIDPFKGMIRTFWGNLTPTMGELDPSVGRIRTFSDAFLPTSKTTLALWNNSASTADHVAVAAALNQMVAQGQSAWGTAVTLRTGKTFAEGFSKPFLAKWKVNLADPNSLSGWDAFDRQRFLLDWYDNLLNFSGMDRVDHWMNAINWSPKLTQTQGGGTKAVIGLIDFYTATDADVRSKTIYYGGYQNVDNAHGAAVASLIVGSHDKRGVMGIAPKATVAAYNPFDATLTASWEDVTRGIEAVGQRGASVINLSLGVKDQTLAAEWRDLFTTSSIDGFKDNVIYVIAAGNDGHVQTNNVDFTGGFDATFLVVGSVDPNGRISSFSNQPGTACLLDGGECKNGAAWNGEGTEFKTTDYLKQSGLLMNRFLVAPGEMILVSDGKGGVTRMSGTSFAAPLVSGAIALIHDRWPWLKHHPRDVAKVLLESAQDLGAPGVDPVYGHGLLDIEAAQSALNFGNLKYYLVNGSVTSEVAVETLRASGASTAWSNSNLYFYAFEKIDSAERDFLIPLSSRLFGTTLNGSQFQEYMHNRFMGWLGNSSFTGRSLGFSSMQRTAMVPLGGGLQIAAYGQYQPVPTRRGDTRWKLNFTNELSATDGSMAFAFGSGNNAALLGGQPALQLAGDYDPINGGANPLLGFASGDGHLAANAALSPKISLTVGWSERAQAFETSLAGNSQAAATRDMLERLGGYAANAMTARVDYRPVANVSVSASYTRLAEKGAFFGTRSLNRNDFGQESVSQGLTLASNAELGSGISLFGSATAARTGSTADGSFQVDNALSTAYQLGVAKEGVISKRDRLRITLTQPLTVESGAIEAKLVGVINRETGEKGIITERFDIAGVSQRRHVGELLYSFDASRSLGFNLFARGDLHPTIGRETLLMAGAGMRLAF